jgi:hypothetical protein
MMSSKLPLVSAKTAVVLVRAEASTGQGTLMVPVHVFSMGVEILLVVRPAL